MNELLPSEVVTHIIEKVRMLQVEDNWDKSWGKLTGNGTFIVSTTWEMVRDEKERRIFLKDLG